MYAVREPPLKLLTSLIGSRAARGVKWQLVSDEVLFRVFWVVRMMSSTPPGLAMVYLLAFLSRGCCQRMAETRVRDMMMKSFMIALAWVAKVGSQPSQVDHTRPRPR